MPIGTAAEIVAVRAPQWSSDPRLSDMVNLAALYTSEATFGDRYQYALALRVLHWLAKEAQAGGDPGTGSSSGSGVAGGIASEKEGDLARSYRAPSTSEGANEDLSTTAYGLELMGLMDACILKARNRFV